MAVVWMVPRVNARGMWRRGREEKVVGVGMGVRVRGREKTGGR
jgi:hypothetical protein